MKLIFCDVDGTLMSRYETSLSRSVCRAMDRVLSAGVKLAIASGRNYIQLRHLFAPFQDELYFIASDGTLTLYKDEVIASHPLRPQLTEECVLHGAYITYIKSRRAPLLRTSYAMYDRHVMQIDDVRDIKSPVYKLTDYTHAPMDSLSHVYHDRTMDEYIASGINKGVAAKALQKHLAIAKNDCCAFGDGDGDLPLFAAVGHAVAAPSAPPRIKQAAGRTCSRIEEELLKCI